MKIKEFDYSLPRELIAQEPLKERDSSRLMILDRQKQTIEHSSFSKLPHYIQQGDLLVANDTRVIPARLYGKKQTGGKAEVLLLRFLDYAGAGAQIWECLVNSRRKLKPQTPLFFSPALQGEVLAAAGGGRWRIKLCSQGSFAAALTAAGKTPLPPYISRQEHTFPEELDRDRYQTVYAACDGAVAAPTAGLHFSQPLIDRLRKTGAEIIFVTLHVGLGTFQPIREENIEDHRMYEEFYHLTPESAARVNQTRRAGGRVICIGTTATRTLETLAGTDGTVQAGEGFTALYIYPGYKFKAIDALITNFHLPNSSLLLLVSAFAGQDLIQSAYAEAIRERYRFYSYGDAMLIA
jgi:S-adenosylmethionine:tRNA ribosyltransferase-isomerase